MSNYMNRMVQYSMNLIQKNPSSSDIEHKEHHDPSSPKSRRQRKHSSSSGKQRGEEQNGLSKTHLPTRALDSLQTDGSGHTNFGNSSRRSQMGVVSETNLVDVVPVKQQDSSLNNAYQCIMKSDSNGFAYDEAESPVDVSAEEERKYQALRAFCSPTLPEPENGMMHLAPFLLPTEICDFRSPNIQELAKEIIDAGTSPFTAACAVRRYVRNNINYVLHPKEMKASETAELKEGMCTNKTNLQVALLRAAGIPAGYTIVHITKDIFQCGETVEPELFEAIHEPTVHVFCSVYIPEAEAFLYFDATEPEVTPGSPDGPIGNKRNTLRYILYDEETGETYLQSRWVRGPCMPTQSNLDHLLISPYRRRNRDPKMDAALRRQNAKYRLSSNCLSLD